MTKRKCTRCKKIRNISLYGEYRVRRTNRLLRRRTCNPCRVEYQQKKYLDPEEVKRAKQRARKSILKNIYGITVEIYNKMRENQKGKCAICESHVKKTMNIDHCHETGKIRGLLCWNCNIGIGYLKHNNKILSNAIKYLGG